jgi:hypothetical protein
MSLFDNLLETHDSQKVKSKPYHTVKDKDDADKLKWLNETVNDLMKLNNEYYQRAKSNLAAYRGLSYQQSSTRSTYRQSERIPTNRTERFVVNHLHDMTETKVAQMTRLKPAIQILPTNQEFSDKMAARATKMLMDHLWYLNDMDRNLQSVHRYKKIFGEAWLFIEWDKYKGDKHPDAGKVLVDEQGQKLTVPADLKTGDVCYQLEVPWRVLLQFQDRFEDCEYMFRIKIKHLDDLKKQYKDKANNIKASSDSSVFDMAAVEQSKMEDSVIVFEFFHKKCKYVDDGAHITFTKDLILESKDLQYSHGDFPAERLTDLDIPEVLRGVSQYEIVKPIQNMHNNLSTLLAKNIYLMGHAKWLMPKGAAKIESLGNDNTIVQYQGPVAPQMLQTQPNPPEAYAFRDNLKNEMEQIYAVHGVSRGQPPNGITAAVALQFLNEQETERASTEIAKANEFIRRVAKKTLSVAGDFYEPDDGRMLRIVGKDNQYIIQYFDSANLSKSYDVRIENGNALSDLKAGKTQRIIEVIQYKPDALSPEQLVELLDLGSVDKVTTLMTEAVRSAESENEDLLQGKPVAPPEDYEDLLIHWRVHTKAMQARSFKEEVPVEFRNEFKAHVADTEFLMVEKAKENALFQAKLAELDHFPIFYKEGYVPQSAAQQEAMVQGQANQGMPITGQIPAQSPQPLPGEPRRGEE